MTPGKLGLSAGTCHWSFLGRYEQKLLMFYGYFMLSLGEDVDKA